MLRINFAGLHPICVRAVYSLCTLCVRAVRGLCYQIFNLIGAFVTHIALTATIGYTGAIPPAFEVRSCMPRWSNLPVKA